MSGYIGSTPVPQATQHRESFTATEGQTTFNTAGYTPQFVDVYLNGSHLSPADFTASNGSDVVLGVAASADDVCDIVSYTPFEVANATFTGTTTTATASLDGAVVINESSADVDFRVESNGNVNMLFVDGSANAVGFGTATPQTIIHSTGAQEQLTLSEGNGKGATFDYRSSTGNLNIATNGANARSASQLTLDLNGRFFIGKDASEDSDGVQGKLQVAAVDATASIMTHRYSANASAPQLILGKSRNGTLNANTVLQAGDICGIVAFHGNDGSGFHEAAQINAVIESGVGNDDVPAALVFKTNAGGTGTTERMRIASGGQIALNTGGVFDISASDGSGVAINDNDGIQMFDSRCRTTTNTFRMRFFNGDDNAAKGAIRTDGNATAFDTSSDYRLKENVVYDWDATTRLKQLKPCRFNWINDDTNTAIDGFLAHEAATVVPNAVNGEKDATEVWENCVVTPSGQSAARNVTEEEWTAGKSTTTDEDGNTVAAKYASNTTWTASHTTQLMQAIDHSFLIPLLVKTIQELEARITALEA